jgi:transcriptional regulator with XRE-family HTH domain
MRTESLPHSTREADTLGSRIAAARRAAGLTQEQLGIGMAPDGSDLGKGAISSWEVDRSQPSSLQLVRLAARLNTTPNDLLGVTRGKSTKAKQAS